MTFPPLWSLSLQLSFSSGDRLLVHTKPSSDWWWAELHEVIGYVPACYLRKKGTEEEEEDTCPEDPWQDEEYFGSYGTLVRNFRAFYALIALDLESDINRVLGGYESELEKKKISDY